jgi:hypothetical protein
MDNKLSCLSPHNLFATLRQLVYRLQLRIVAVFLITWLVSLSATQAQTCPPALQTPSAEQIQQALRSARNRGFLWKITKDNRSSYLYGTIHLGRLEWFFPGPDLAAALRNVDMLALEVDPLDEKIQQALVASQQEKRQVALPVKLRQRLDRQISAVCVPDQAVAHLNPIMQTVMISMLRGRFQGFEVAYGQEIALKKYPSQTNWQARHFLRVSRNSTPRSDSGYHPGNSDNSGKHTVPVRERKN